MQIMWVLLLKKVFSEIGSFMEAGRHSECKTAPVK
jgi:hypothetical protein